MGLVYRSFSSGEDESDEEDFVGEELLFEEEEEEEEEVVGESFSQYWNSLSCQSSRNLVGLETIRGGQAETRSKVSLQAWLKWFLRLASVEREGTRRE